MASSEARELGLIDKLELKVALAESNAALQKILSTYLPPLLLKLASEHLRVRNKVSQVLFLTPSICRAFGRLKRSHFLISALHLYRSESFNFWGLIFRT